MGSLLAFTLTPEVQPFLRSLHDEQNLLHYTTHLINVDEVVKITEMAYTLEWKPEIYREMRF